MTKDPDSCASGDEMGSQQEDWLAVQDARSDADDVDQDDAVPFPVITDDDAEAADVWLADHAEPDEDAPRAPLTEAQAQEWCEIADAGGILSEEKAREFGVPEDDWGHWTRPVVLPEDRLRWAREAHDAAVQDGGVIDNGYPPDWNNADADYWDDDVL